MKYLIFLLSIAFSTPLLAQTETKPADIYHPDANAEAEIAAAVKKADAEGKNVLIMIGGNWCRWCRMYDKFRLENARVDSASNANFVFLHVNFSKENKNIPVMESLDSPQRFGFPVFVILDSKGKRIHTQNSAYLEEGEGYNEKKVLEFYSQWSPAAIEPSQYR